VTSRDRLLLAFANLNSYGIDSRPAFGTTRRQAEAVILDELEAQHPGAIGSWVFWTEPDDDAFTADGEPSRPLELHCSADDVVRAVLAACNEEDILAEADRSSAVRLF
jgi:hypothetical protein